MIRHASTSRQDEGHDHTLGEHGTGHPFSGTLRAAPHTGIPMKRMAALVLLLIASPAWSQAWIRYAQTDTATFYFDSLRTRKMGDTAFVWDLHDLNSPATDTTGRVYRSIMHATEYQCRARKHRVLGILQHPEPMAGGTAVEVVSAGAWISTLPDSLAGELFNHICE